MEVLVSLEDGDDCGETETASAAFLLILLFVVVGSIGSHLTRAAFEERLVIVVVFLLLGEKKATLRTTMEQHGNPTLLSETHEVSHCCWPPMIEPGRQMRSQAMTSAAVKRKCFII
ncbi:hypothetical protein E2C01_019920 [Portunus trituberculatus]|uniref:Uncharacterized protein n=1 Tax=Portunus trituberculatus TaxID=210409 RepID=A0A5B7E1R3_PORTR|nr:hypothetical protein [Portunus trituberculatus]